MSGGLSIVVFFSNCDGMAMEKEEAHSSLWRAYKEKRKNVDMSRAPLGAWCVVVNEICPHLAAAAFYEAEKSDKNVL